MPPDGIQDKTLDDEPDLEGFAPKGPLPLFLSDLENSTPGWSGEERWMYLRLLSVMWSNGGYIDADERTIAEAMGLNRARNWREKAEKVICKLVSSARHSGKKTQFRLLRDIKKAKDISDKRKNAAAQRGSKCKANALSNSEQMQSSPSPTPSPSKEEPTTPRARGPCPLPEDWEPNKHSIEVGKQEGYSDEEIKWLAAGFADWSDGKRKKNWNATFNNWLRSGISHKDIDQRRRSLNGGSAVRERQRGGGAVAATTRYLNRHADRSDMG